MTLTQTVATLDRPAVANDPSAEIDRRIHSAPRLKAVRDSDLLDSEPEESFDALTRLAARLLKVPASFVSIVGADRDFYKSEFGFGEPLASTRTLAGRTFCHYTLASPEMLVIEDTLADPQWAAVPTVETLGVRAYVGVPLQYEGQIVGSFCAIDMQPRQWSADELEILAQLATSAGRELTLRSALAAARDESARARALARSREEMVAVMAHDLRTPLQVLDLSVNLLQRDLAPGQEAVARRMTTAVDAMKRMADGLLSSTALLRPLESNQGAVDAPSVVADAMTMMTPIAERAGVALNQGGVAPASLAIDYSLMLRILGNLVGNAIKYSSEGSAVEVAGVREGARLVLSVTDNGKGMSAQEQERAFERGFQGAESLYRGDGAGLGLAIVHQLVTSHGGQVELVSEPGRGTRVTLHLPCR